MGTASVSIIIPVFNEERTIGSVIEVARTWKSTLEVIVINDGSTDKTARAVKQFGTTIQCISYTKNRGKGFAMALGIEKAHGEIILFLDGDIVGLSHIDLDHLLSPLVEDKADMVMGVVRLWTKKTSQPVFDPLSGERIMWKKDLLPLVSHMKEVGYGVELLINHQQKEKRIVMVKLPYCRIIGKMHKATVPQAMRSYVKEARELIAQVIRQQTDDLSPPAVRMVNSIQQYLKQMLDNF